MFSYYPKQCIDCNIKDLLQLVDKKLAKEINKEWNEKKFLINSSFCSRSYKNLIRYKNILEKLRFNYDYLSPEIDQSEFLSKVKIAVR